MIGPGRCCTRDLVSRTLDKGIRERCADNARDALKGIPEAWTYAGTVRANGDGGTTLGQLQRHSIQAPERRLSRPADGAALEADERRFSAPRGVRPADMRRTRSMETGDRPAAGLARNAAGRGGVTEVMVVAGSAGSGTAADGLLRSRNVKRNHIIKHSVPTSPHAQAPTQAP